MDGIIALALAKKAIGPGGGTTVTVGGVAQATWDADTKLSKSEVNASGISTTNGRITVGNNTTSTTNAFLHIRQVTNSITGKDVNGACFAVNGDGTASFQHKTYNNDGSGAKNTAILRFSNQGIQFAINTGTGASPTEAMYKELATIDYFTGGTGIKVEDGVISLDLEAAEGVSV